MVVTSRKERVTAGFILAAGVHGCHSPPPIELIIFPAGGRTDEVVDSVQNPFDIFRLKPSASRLIPADLNRLVAVRRLTKCARGVSIGNVGRHHKCLMEWRHSICIEIDNATIDGISNRVGANAEYRKHAVNEPEPKLIGLCEVDVIDKAGG